MAFVTVPEARAAARGMTSTMAATELRKSASAPPSAQYHIFLSHSREDAVVIAGVKTLLENEGLRVYVYWAEEDQSDQVTAATAANLRLRMNNCQALVYASSQASPRSRWMPWELGYFDGRKPGRVAIMPLPSSTSADFHGQEYLGLYPKVERISWQSGRRGLGVRTGATSAKGLAAFIDTGVTI